MEKTRLYLLLLIGAANSLSDIVTLRKENEVLCITQDVTLPTFISPPFTENSTKSLSLLNGEDWSYDNWILTNGSNSVSGPVTDKRWETSMLSQGDYKRACNLCNKFTYKDPTIGLLIGITIVLTTISLMVFLGSIILIEVVETIMMVVKSINETELQRGNVT
jgi:hypothetical protein